MYVAEDDAQRRGLVGEALRAHRQERIRPIADDFRHWLAAVEPTRSPCIS
jgi:hypothetical protein